MHEVRPTRDPFSKKGQPVRELKEANSTDGSHEPDPRRGAVDNIIPRLVGDKILFDMTRRDGQEFCVVVPIHHGTADLILDVMNLIWSHDPAAARALLEHLNEEAPRPPT